jgi:hypothetical protein
MAASFAVFEGKVVFPRSRLTLPISSRPAQLHAKHFEILGLVLRGWVTILSRVLSGRGRAALRRRALLP